MRINCLALDHKILPLEVREKIVFSHDQAIQFLTEFRQRYQIKDVLLLSTCNRTELYILANNSHEGFGILNSILQKWQTDRDFRVPIQCAAIHSHGASVRRLLRIAAGLESQIIGESEVLGQVRTAKDLSDKAGATGKVMIRLWEKALRCGKRVRSETRLGDGALSVAYGVLWIARKIHGSLKGLSFGIIGAGEISELVLKNLDTIEDKKLKILNRSPERAELLASRFGGIAGSLDELAATIQESDVVICSTGSQIPLIKKDELSTVLKERKRSLLLIDLGVPRDIEPDCGNLPQIFLNNLDDIARLIEENLDERRSAIPEALEIVDHEAHRFELWLNGLRSEPALKALRKAMEDACQFELELLKDEVDQETHEKLQVLLPRLVKRVLHKPTEDLRAQGGDLEPRFLKQLEALFQMEDRPESEDSA